MGRQVNCTDVVAQAILDHRFILGIFYPEQEAIVKKMSELITPIVWALAIQHVYDDFAASPAFNGADVLERLRDMKDEQNAPD
jgi:hypothetical protein